MTHTRTRTDIIAEEPKICGVTVPPVGHIRNYSNVLATGNVIFHYLKRHCDIIFGLIVVLCLVL